MILPRFWGLEFNDLRGQYGTLLRHMGRSGFHRYIFNYIRVACPLNTKLNSSDFSQHSDAQELIPVCD